MIFPASAADFPGAPRSMCEIDHPSLPRASRAFYSTIDVALPVNYKTSSTVLSC